MNRLVQIRRVVPVAVCVVGLTGSCTESDVGSPADPANASYVIEGKTVQLESGAFRDEEGEVSLFASKRGDMDADGDADLLAILRRESPGTGIFYYLNVLMDDGATWNPAGSEFLGDRIRFDFADIYGEGSVSPVTGVEIHADDYGQAVVAFYQHDGEQSFAEEPMFYITRHWRVSDGRLQIIENY